MYTRTTSFTMKEIKIKAEQDMFILKIKESKKERRLECNRNLNSYSLCDGVLIFTQRIIIIIPSILQKLILKEFQRCNLLWEAMYT